MTDTPTPDDLGDRLRQQAKISTRLGQHDDLYELAEEADHLTAEVKHLWALLAKRRAQQHEVDRLEDAVLTLWAEMPAETWKGVVDDYPALADFVRHLHHSIEHEQAMVRQNVWADASATAGGDRPAGPAGDRP